MLWGLDTVTIREDHCENDEDRALQIFNDSIQICNCKYLVSKLWKFGHQPLPSNIDLSNYSLKSLLKSLGTEPNLTEQ